VLSSGGRVPPLRSEPPGFQKEKVMKERNELKQKINALLDNLEIERTVDLEKLSTAVLRGIYVNLTIRALNNYYEKEVSSC
jgi:hypothetical protein